jgi:hypothetical protein
MANSRNRQRESRKYWLVLDPPGERGLTSPLMALFGGETRIEFGVRGRWFDPNGNPVTDAPLIMEFCAKRGIIARQAIEKYVVNHLKEGGEEAVLVVETPINGYMH